LGYVIREENDYGPWGEESSSKETRREKRRTLECGRKWKKSKTRDISTRESKRTHESVRRAKTDIQKEKEGHRKGQDVWGERGGIERGRIKVEREKRVCINRQGVGEGAESLNLQQGQEGHKS